MTLTYNLNKFKVIEYHLSNKHSMTEVQERERVIGNDLLWTRILQKSTMILTFDLET